MKKDPVCNMDVDEGDAFTAECEGKTFYFCSEGCKEKFLKERTCKVPRNDYDLIIIGGGPAGLTAAVYAATLNSALQIVENLRTVAKNIYLISDTELTADASIIERVCRFENLRRYEGHKIVEFSGGNTLSGVTIRKVAEKEAVLLPVKGIFIAIGLQPNTSLVSHLVNVNERGEIIINPDCSTSCPGMFAAGDVTNAFGKRIIIASGEGAKAALATRQYLLKKR